MHRTQPALALSLTSPHPIPRTDEPITLGVPFPRGLLSDAERLTLHAPDGNAVPVQARCLDRWPDGFVRWALVDWQATVAGSASYRLGVADGLPVQPPGPRATIHRADGRLVVETGAARFVIAVGTPFPFTVEVPGHCSPMPTHCAVRLTPGSSPGTGLFLPRVTHLSVVEPGPLRVSVLVECGRLEGAEGGTLDAVVFGVLDFFAGSATCRLRTTIRNPRRAAHPGGTWDLGDAGSLLLDEVALSFRLPPGDDPTSLRLSTEPGREPSPVGEAFQLFQASSGGDNWDSPNHVDRSGRVPLPFRGYRLTTAAGQSSGPRATPVVVAERTGHYLAVAAPRFWENFPKSLTAEGGEVRVGLFPFEGGPHELQGGEQKTHTVVVAFAVDRVTTEPLAWCRSPLVPGLDPTWVCATGAVPYLTPKREDPNLEYLALVDAALDGPDTFAAKRERIDEYGWRHFGDIYGDHEAVFHKGPKPLVSHYNNQYDPIAGAAYQWLRSGDGRWRDLMTDLAAHVIDIDIYHTDRDKAAYNRGLFWHTVHYIDADTSTHRSYPRRGSNGGGPSCEHTYTTGLTLLYYLTGDPLARQTAIDLADWVIRMDDGDSTPLRRLDRSPTGLASYSGTFDYHGPGRGSGNSVNALIDAHRLTGEQRFLEKAEELIRRVIHPADDVAARDLLDAERRWYYTVFLQALGKYLDHKVERGELDWMYAYARAALLHYARWMAEHERPTLSHPEILEFPTETWAAQDVRKSEVFEFALKHSTDRTERERFRERAAFFFDESITTLSRFPTRTLCRPVVLMMSYGFRHAYFQTHPGESAPPPREAVVDFGKPEVFVTQKARVKRKLKRLMLGFGAAVVLLGGGAVAAYALIA